MAQDVLNDEPLSLSLPKNVPKMVFHVLMLPIIVPLWLTINWFDVRKPEKRNFFILSYILSIGASHENFARKRALVE